MGLAGFSPATLLHLCLPAAAASQLSCVTPPAPRIRSPQGDQKRLLLAALTKSLSEVLPFLERMLELNFAGAGTAVQAGNRELAQQHVSVIQAALAAANTYAGGREADACKHFGGCEGGACVHMAASGFAR